MKTKFYLDGKKTTRKAVKELVGEERLKRMLKEAKETFFEDPKVQNDFFHGKQMLTIVVATEPIGFEYKIKVFLIGVVTSLANRFL